MNPTRVLASCRLACKPARRTHTRPPKEPHFEDFACSCCCALSTPEAICFFRREVAGRIFGLDGPKPEPIYLTGRAGGYLADTASPTPKRKDIDPPSAFGLQYEDVPYR
jgi:hypothetical protein